MAVSLSDVKIGKRFREMKEQRLLGQDLMVVDAFYWVTAAKKKIVLSKTFLFSGCYLVEITNDDPNPFPSHLSCFMCKVFVAEEG
jgi:hypothetical protein